MSDPITLNFPVPPALGIHSYSCVDVNELKNLFAQQQQSIFQALQAGTDLIALQLACAKANETDVAIAEFKRRAFTNENVKWTRDGVPV